MWQFRTRDAALQVLEFYGMQLHYNIQNIGCHPLGAFRCAILNEGNFVYKDKRASSLPTATELIEVGVHIEANNTGCIKDISFQEWRSSTCPHPLGHLH